MADGESELERYPVSGRFLMGRLRHAMSVEEKEILEGLASETRVLEPSEVVVKRGDVVNCSNILIEGYMTRSITEEGKRFIVGVQVPGDFVDLHGFALKRLDHDLAALGPAKIAYVPHERLEEVMVKWPHLARLLWFSTLLDAAIHREWIMKMEQLTASRRAAHIFCEIWHRLEMVGLGGPRGVRTPLTQADLAEMCGTTSIHMSRALGEMRKAGIAEFRRGNLHVDDRVKLEEYARFNSTYLYGEGLLGMGEELSVD
ncbi:Crp/Fnr family transcriptional regulator [Paraurantiacibacter namhicola]|uniref:Fumarate and nitrate reduction regulatory protein n=1 Tax=Paraurantiacibacter namhicola TaxID=645517 RepID=A0A1C7D4P0_9SPHN|nr:Crp/Fnr family transcriptional regulator [Paraurantiacibacter namhicola]ANU06424.1 Fumarate and nitrate reduction regulatory protein [Paraurantiacibacter namhicola]